MTPSHTPPSPHRRRLLLGAASLIVTPMGAAAAAPTLRAQRLAWAGVRLSLPGATLVIDAISDPDVWGKALPDPLPALTDLEGDRYALITHRHPDHFDPKAVAKVLGDRGALAYPVGMGTPVVPGVTRLRAAPMWEPQILGDFTVTAAPAVDGYGDPQVSWVVSGGGRRVLHAGDTLWHGAWWQIGRQFGPFDAVFLPINGARFGWRQPASEMPGVMTPEQAVAAAVILGARTLVPIHYGVSGADGYAEQPDALAAATAEARRRGVSLTAVPAGGWLDWPD